MNTVFKGISVTQKGSDYSCVKSQNTLFELSDPGTMKFVYVLGQSPRDWKTTRHQNAVPKKFIHKIYVTMLGKSSELHCNVLLFSNRGKRS